MRLEARIRHQSGDDGGDYQSSVCFYRLADSNFLLEYLIKFLVRAHGPDMYRVRLGASPPGPGHHDIKTKWSNVMRGA